MRLAPAAAVALPVLAAHAAPLAEPTCEHTNVLILGAGVAGLTAAQTLHDNGVDNFIVLEAREQSGGRLYSYNFEVIRLRSGPTGFTDLEDGKVATSIPCGLWLDKVETKNEDRAVYPKTSEAAISNALKRAEEATTKVLDDAVDILKSNRQDQSFRAGQRLEHWDPAKTDPAGQLADWWAWDWEAASTPEENSEVFGAISTIATYNYFSKSDWFICDKDGYVSALRKNVSAVLDGPAERVRFKHKVTQIKYDPNGVTVTSDQGCFTANYAIVTFSLGVLQRGNVKFDPPLPPWKTQSIAGFEIGTYTKIFLKFESSFWDQKQFLLRADPHVRGNYPVFQPLDIPGLYEHSNILVATVTGEQSYRIESQTDDETADEILEVLKEMYGANKVSELKEIHYPRWTQEDWSYGSYSYWPPSTSLQEHQNLRANVDRVYFAGEATSQEFFGYLHGAYYEGKHVAEYLAPCVGDPEATWCDQTNYEVLSGVTPYNLYNPVNGWYIYNETLGVPGHD